MTQTTLPNSNQIVVNEQNMFANPWFIYLQGLFKAIRAKFSLNLRGILSINTTPVSNVDAAETDLITYSLQANTMANNNDVLDVTASGVFAANGNNKTLKLNFGSQTILDTGIITSNGDSWEITATIIRLSPTSQEITASIISSDPSLILYARTAGTQDLTTILTVECTGQGSTSDDLTQNVLITSLTPND